MNPATVWARSLVDEMARAGVEHVCIAPGSRSTPLVLAVAEDARFRPHVQLDERSAGFFALGVAKATGKPAAVITTSGTAVANLHPAVVEASHSEAPLLVLSADRPARLRHADANQTIDQVGFFGRYVREAYDLDSPSLDDRDLRHLRALVCRVVATAVGPPAGPVHVNVPFDKPFEPAPEEAGAPAVRVDGEGVTGRRDGAPYTRMVASRAVPPAGEVARLAQRMRAAARGVLVAGPLAEAARSGPALRLLAEWTGLPLLADPLSGARFGADGQRVVGGYDLILHDPGVRTALRPDLVVRFGQAPTSARLGEWLVEHGDAPQIVIDAGGRWKDHQVTATEYLRADPGALSHALVAELSAAADRDAPSPPPPTDWAELWHALDEIARARVAHARETDFFEGVLLAEVFASSPSSSPFFVSSSMPVRDLDAFVPAGPERAVFGNRGASGIDGIVSTALGVAAGMGERAVVVLGDIAFIHDMNGLLATREDGVGALFVVIHNDGGGIFQMLPIRDFEPYFTPFFATPHGRDFEHAARLHGLSHSRPSDMPKLRAALATALDGEESHIVEVISDPVENRLKRRAVAEDVTDAVRKRLREEGIQ